MYIPGFSVSPPEWYAAAEKSGAVKEMVQDTTILGYRPYQRAKQAVIISGIAAALLWACNGPEKGGIAGIFIVAVVASICLKLKFEEEKVEIMRIHNRIIRDGVQSSTQ